MQFIIVQKSRMEMVESNIKRVQVWGWIGVMVLCLLQLHFSGTHLFPLSVYLVRLLFIFEVLLVLGTLIKLKITWMVRITKLFLLLLRLALLFVYLEAEGQQYIRSMFMMVVGVSELLKHEIARQGWSYVPVRAISTIRTLMLVPLTYYLGISLMSKYIKRHAETISYEEINLIRVQQLLYWLIILRYLIKGLLGCFVNEQGKSPDKKEKSPEEGPFPAKTD